MDEGAAVELLRPGRYRPPYASLELHRAKGTTTRLATSASSSNAWFGILPNAKLPELVSESFRVLRNNRHFYLWCDEPTADVVKRQQFIVDPSGEIVRNSDGVVPLRERLQVLALARVGEDEEEGSGGSGRRDGLPTIAAPRSGSSSSRRASGSSTTSGYPTC